MPFHSNASSPRKMLNRSTDLLLSRKKKETNRRTTWSAAACDAREPLLQCCDVHEWGQVVWLSSSPPLVQDCSPFPGSPPWSLTASFFPWQHHVYTGLDCRLRERERARGLGGRARRTDTHNKTKTKDMLRCDDMQAQNVPQAPFFAQTGTGTRPEHVQNKNRSRTHTHTRGWNTESRPDGRTTPRDEEGRRMESLPLHEREKEARMVPLW